MKVIGLRIPRPEARPKAWAKTIRRIIMVIRPHAERHVRRCQRKSLQWKVVARSPITQLQEAIEMSLFGKYFEFEPSPDNIPVHRIKCKLCGEVMTIQTAGMGEEFSSRGIQERIDKETHGHVMLHILDKLYEKVNK